MLGTAGDIMMVDMTMVGMMIVIVMVVGMVVMVTGMEPTMIGHRSLPHFCGVDQDSTPSGFLA